MPKFPFCKAACDNSAHQCLSGESFPWTSGQPMVFLSIQSLEPLQSFFWDRLAEFIVWSATAETQNTSKYNPWKLLHRWSVVASWEPAKKRLGPNAQVAQPAAWVQHPSTKTLEHNARTLGELAFLFGILLWKKARPWGRWGLIFLELEHLVLSDVFQHAIFSPKHRLSIGPWRIVASRLRFLVPRI